MTIIQEKASLSCARRRLVELMQQINHGRIQELTVSDGDPVLEPTPEILRIYLFGKDNGPNAALSSEDFVLKKNVTEMFEFFDQEQSFVIDELVIANGLPVRMNVR